MKYLLTGLLVTSFLIGCAAPATSVTYPDTPTFTPTEVPATVVAKQVGVIEITSDTILISGNAREGYEFRIAYLLYDKAAANIDFFCNLDGSQCLRRTILPEHVCNERGLVKPDEPTISSWECVLDEFWVKQ